jgi:hypothetical protein
MRTWTDTLPPAAKGGLSIDQPAHGNGREVEQIRGRGDMVEEARGAKQARRRKALIAEDGYAWSKSPATVHTEFAKRTSSGIHPDDVFRQMIAEITDHHQQGIIDNRDAHRAANEAFGRLLFARKRRGEYSGSGDVEKKSGPFAGPNDSFPVGTSKDLDDAKDVCNMPSVRGKHPGTCEKVDEMKSPKTGTRKQSWSGFGPTQFPKKPKVAGWQWDEHLAAYVAKPGVDQFTCHCGAKFTVPDYYHCGCGTIHNAYVIGVGGDKHQAAAEKILCREIPSRDGVIVASRRKKSELQDNSWEHEADGSESFPSDHHPDHGNWLKSTPSDWYRRDVNQRWTVKGAGVYYVDKHPSDPRLWSVMSGTAPMSHHPSEQEAQQAANQLNSR